LSWTGVLSFYNRRVRETRPRVWVRNVAEARAALLTLRVRIKRCGLSRRDELFTGLGGAVVNNFGRLGTYDLLRSLWCGGVCAFDAGSKCAE
jgi:hypothetical protein